MYEMGGGGGWSVRVVGEKVVGDAGDASDVMQVMQVMRYDNPRMHVCRGT